MENIYTILVLVLFVCLVVGLIRPSIFSRFMKGWATRGKIGLIFSVATFAFFILFGITSDKNKAIQNAGNENSTVQNSEPVPLSANQEAQTKEEKTGSPSDEFVKVTSFTGSQAGKSKEFTINSKEIKFASRCDVGPVVCTAWLKQVAGEQKQLFHSSGSTSTLSDEKTLSVGPGTFYIEIDTRDRNYVIDVFQSTTQASENEKNDAQVKTDESAKYKNVSGFKLTSENGVSGELFYDYETNNGVYRVELTVDPNVTNFKLESDYTLAKSSLKINDIDIQYAFDKGAILNGYEVFKPYEDIELTFVADNKTHIGLVRQVNSREAINKAGIESTMKAFLTALMPNIKGSK